MAQFVGSDGCFLDVMPVRYQFTDATGDDYDANWLVIRMTASDGTQAWSTENPIFLTWEMYDLVEWLRQAARGVAGPDTTFSGIEPNLRFEVERIGACLHLRAILDLEFLPPDAEGEVVLEFRLDAHGLRRFADALETDLRAFPIRLIEAEGPAKRANIIHI